MNLRTHTLTHLSRGAFLSVVTVFALMATVAHAQQISNKPLIDITGYVIDATVIPETHQLHATAKVSFTALDTLPVATFELHSGLKVSKVTDANDHPLNAERGAASTLRVTAAEPLAKGEKAVWSFEYDGTLENGDNSPVEGLKLASIGDPISYLLYAGALVPDDGISDGPLHRGHYGARACRVHGAGIGLHGRAPCAAGRRDVAVQLGPARLSGHDRRGEIQRADRRDGPGKHQDIRDAVAKRVRPRRRRRPATRRSSLRRQPTASTTSSAARSARRSRPG